MGEGAGGDGGKPVHEDGTEAGHDGALAEECEASDEGRNID